MRDSLVGQRLILAFLLGVVLLNDPVLTLFDRGQQLAGIPLVYLYLFAVWSGLIAGLALTLSAGEPADRDGDR
jgi:hypothetical protein